MKERIVEFIHHLLIYDYLLFGGVVLLFILMLLVAIMVRRKVALAVILIISAFLLLTVGPVVGYWQLHRYLFQHRIVLEEAKALEFTQALLVRGSVQNLSKRPFQECVIEAGVYKVTPYRWLNPIYPYMPFKRGSIRLDKPIQPGEEGRFKLFLEPFRYTQEYNITVKADCR